MSTPPGWTLKDVSVEFWRDVVGFFERRREKLASRDFNGRFLLKTTTFLGSSRSVAALLASPDFGLGYRDYLSHVYGDVILFADRERAADLRAIFAALFHHSAFRSFQSGLRASVRTFLLPQRNHSDQDVCLYSLWKRLSAELMISLFLDLDPGLDGKLVEEIIRLSTLHWHGIISVPVPLKGLGFSNGASKSSEARAELQALVRARLKAATEASGSGESFLRQVGRMPWASEEEAVDHLVLLVTALVPKALASLLTSAVLTSEEWLEEVWDGSAVDEEALRCVLLECARLWPPFVGGRRVAERDTLVGELAVPAGRPVVYLAQAAHRDPAVFPDPAAFRWRRFQTHNRSDADKVWWFGGGARDCVGKAVMQDLLLHVLAEFVATFEWRRLGPARPDYKWLPVSRPKDKPLFRLTTRPPKPRDDDASPQDEPQA